MATRETIILDQWTSGGTVFVRAAYWLVPPANRASYANPSATSQVPPQAAASYGYTSAELGLLRSGALLEQVTIIQVTASGISLAIIQAAVQAQYTALQDTLNATANAVAHVIGSYWDGTTWTAGP